MSHLATVQAEFRCEASLRAACDDLKLPAPERGTFSLYSATVAGLGIRLPGWRFPAVVNTDDGSIRFDNYNGSWGDPKHLDQLKQRYAVARIHREARMKGQRVIERAQADGSVKMTVTV